jgi:hypothetical protein
MLQETLEKLKPLSPEVVAVHAEVARQYNSSLHTWFVSSALDAHHRSDLPSVKINKWTGFLQSIEKESILGDWLAKTRHLASSL